MTTSGFFAFATILHPPVPLGRVLLASLVSSRNKSIVPDSTFHECDEACVKRDRVRFAECCLHFDAASSNSLSRTPLLPVVRRHPRFGHFGVSGRKTVSELSGLLRDTSENTKIQRHKGPEAREHETYESRAPLCLCVSVSLCL